MQLQQLPYYKPFCNDEIFSVIKSKTQLLDDICNVIHTHIHSPNPHIFRKNNTPLNTYHYQILKTFI